MAARKDALVQRRHLPFYLGAAAALLSLPFGLTIDRRLALQLAAVLFFFVYLLMIALRLPKLDGAYLKDNAAGTDEPAIVILAVTLAAVIVCLASLFRVLNDKAGAPLIEQVLAFAAVALGWLTVHVMAAIHYAHRYWSPEMSTAEHGDDNPGLDFPKTDMPGIYEFLYFSFVVGMTAQTSDVAITSTEMRRINLLHSVVSYFFNTVLIAVAVNAAVSLL